MKNLTSKISAVLMGLLVLWAVAGLPLTPAYAESLRKSRLEEALHKFAGEQNFRAEIDWNAKTLTPRSIFNLRTPAAAGTPETIARRFIRQYNDLFLMTNAGTDLKLTLVQESLAARHVRFQQTYQGIPVYDGFVSVHMTKRGEVQVIHNNYQPDIDVATVSQIAKDQAIEMASEVLDLGSLRGEITSELMIYPGDDKYFLAWRVLIPAASPLGDWELLIDALNGDVLAQHNLLRFAEGRGRVFNPNAIVALRDNGLRDPLAADTGRQPTTPEAHCDPNVVPSAAYSDVTLRGLDGSGTLTGEFVNTSTTPNRVTASDMNFSYGRCTGGFLEVMVYHHIDSMERYIHSLGFNNINNRSINVNAHGFIPNSPSQDQSFYSSLTKSLTFGLGGVADAEDAEIIGHEYGHSIQDNQVPGFPGFTNEAGALGEGWGDYWAASFESRFSGGFQDECLGEWDASFYDLSHVPHCLRRLDGRKQYPRDLDGEVHDDGEIWSASLWSIRALIGGEKMDRLALESHFMLSTNARFRDAANAVLTANRNLYGGQDGATIRQVFVQRGILEAVAETSKLYFPLFLNGYLASPFILADSYTTGLAFVNPSSQTANLTFTAYSLEDGNVIAGPGITNPATRTLGPGAQTAFFASEVFGFTNAQRGWIEVSSDVDVKGFFLILDSNFSHVANGTDVSGSLTRELILMHREVDPARAVTSIYALCNPNTVPADLVIYFYNLDGTLDSSQFRVAPKATHIVALTDPALRGGYMRVSSTQPITGVELFGMSAWISALRAAPVGNQATDLFFPHFAVNGGFTTEFSALNPTTSMADLRITAYRNDGTEIGTIGRRLIAGQQVLESVGDAFGIGGSNLEVGYLRVQSTVPGLLGYTNFNYANQTGAAVPVALASSTNLTFAHIAHGVRTPSGSSFITGVALVNPSDSQTATYTISVFNNSGTMVAQRAGLTLAPRQKVSQLLHEFFTTSLPELAGGYITVTSTVGLFGFELFLTDNVDRIAAVPSQ